MFSLVPRDPREEFDVRQFLSNTYFIDDWKTTITKKSFFFDNSNPKDDKLFISTQCVKEVYSELRNLVGPAATRSPTVAHKES